ncbi:MAG: hypothetical protein U0264_00690 [Candidatus Kapaibacterium sp.]
MQRQTIQANFLKTICWLDDSIIDFASAGTQYTMDGRAEELLKYSFTYFDSAITSSDGQYAFLYKKLGTKGVLLKNGKQMREINRSYYHADAYEYPATFITVEQRIFLIHCPISYDRLEFEDVETGEVITDIQERKPTDFFHTRLEVSPSGKYLMSKGWHWHPYDGVRLFDIQKCISMPTLLDNSEVYPAVGTEVCTASFIDDTKIVLGASGEEGLDDNLIENLPQRHIAIWDCEAEQFTKPVKVNAEFGNLFAINDKFAWDTYKFPKIIDLETGDVVDSDESLSSGLQKSAIDYHMDTYPKIVFNYKTKQLAITNKYCIEILTQ